MFEGQLAVNGHRLEFGGVTHVMGVVNVSPESRNPHTIATTPGEALSLARRYREWGCDLIDLGGQSSHFENPTITDEEEIARVVPVIEALVGDGFVVSVDTWKPAVARAALAAGVDLVNDTGGLKNPEMREVMSSHPGAGVIAVYLDAATPHSVGSVSPGQDKAERTAEWFGGLLADLGPGMRRQLILDPGIAINYRGDYTVYTRLQLEVIRNAAVFAPLDRPLLIPIPRKRDIHWVTAYIALALEYGADLIRVHDVAIAADLTRLWGREVKR